MCHPGPPPMMWSVLLTQLLPLSVTTDEPPPPGPGVIAMSAAPHSPQGSQEPPKIQAHMALLPPTVHQSPRGLPWK